MRLKDYRGNFERLIDFTLLDYIQQFMVKLHTIEIIGYESDFTIMKLRWCLFFDWIEKAKIFGFFYLAKKTNTT